MHFNTIRILIRLFGRGSKMSEEAASSESGGNLAGNFRDRLTVAEDILVEDFKNPWNFYFLFMSDEDTVISWCRAIGLLASTITCPKKVKVGVNDDGSNIMEDCGGLMLPKSRSFRCSNNRNHERTERTYSFFHRTHLTIPDVMVFVKSYLDKLTLLQCTKFSGVAYGTTAVNWASYVRELFKEHFHRNTKHVKLSGEIEIDESLFGRRMKYKKGNPNAGLKIWIFGMVERESNKIILYPVSERSKEVLIPLITRHVETGSTIYSDGWSAYCDLNDIGYTHFTVLHKYSFTKTYVNQATGEEITVHTNRIEGCWKHAKEHFKRMSGTKLSQFEGHLAEVMWRSEVKGKVYEKFFELLKSVYTLDAPADYLYTTPLFDSWSIDSSDTPSGFTIEPMNTDAESEANSEGSSNAPLVISSASISDIPPNRPVAAPFRMPGSMSTQELTRLFSSTSLSSDDEHEKTLVVTSPIIQPDPKPAPPSRIHTTRSTATAAAEATEAGPSGTASRGARPKTRSRREPTKSNTSSETKKRMRTQKVCHPKGFAEKKSEGKAPKKGQKTNVYSKSAYVWDWTSDDDFQ